jgi:hypothetical protein
MYLSFLCWDTIIQFTEPDGAKSHTINAIFPYLHNISEERVLSNPCLVLFEEKFSRLPTSPKLTPCDYFL